MQARNSKALLAAAVVIPPVICALVVGAAWWLERTGGDRAPEPTRAQIENVARITLPASARGVHARIEGFQDRIAWVRFDLPTTELPAFVRGTRCDGLHPGAPAASPGGPGEPWWQPDQGARRESCHGEGVGFDQVVSVDESDPTRVVVYVVTFEH